MRETLLLMELLKEVHRGMGMSDQRQQSGVNFTVFEDNSTVFEDNNDCIELATCPKIRPRTKHTIIKHSHFRSKELDGTIKILDIVT